MEYQTRLVVIQMTVAQVAELALHLGFVLVLEVRVTRSAVIISYFLVDGRYEWIY